MENTTGLSNCGVVVSVRGSVVDIRFDKHLPPIYSVLRAGADKEKPYVLRDCRRRGELAGAKVGSKIVYTRADLLEFLERQKENS